MSSSVVNAILTVVHLNLYEITLQITSYCLRLYVLLSKFQLSCNPSDRNFHLAMFEVYLDCEIAR